METLWDIGEKVILKGVVKEIHITKERPDYVVRVYSNSEFPRDVYISETALNAMNKED